MLCFKLYIIAPHLAVVRYQVHLNVFLYIQRRLQKQLC